MDEMDKLLPQHGGYRRLKSFQLARLIFDITVRFCERYVSRFSRTRDQMVQAARSGVQNIAEGSQASGTSKKTELKLTNVARASLEELRLDYEDFLRQGSFTLWDSHDPRRDELVRRRCSNADQVALWVKELHQRTQEPLPELAANAVLVLLAVCTTLLDRQIDAQSKAFLNEGGFTERLYRTRKATRNKR